MSELSDDDDLRDLLWRMGQSPAEIEIHLANPYTRAYLRLFLEKLHEAVAERIAARLIRELFPNLSDVN